MDRGRHVQARDGAKRLRHSASPGELLLVGHRVKFRYLCGLGHTDRRVVRSIEIGTIEVEHLGGEGRAQLSLEMICSTVFVLEESLRADAAGVVDLEADGSTGVVVGSSHEYAWIERGSSHR